MLRSKCTASMAAGLLAGMVALSSPAQALTVAVDLSIYVLSGIHTLATRNLSKRHAAQRPRVVLYRHLE